MKCVIHTPDGRQYAASSLRAAFDMVRADAIGYYDADLKMPSRRDYMRMVSARVAEWNKARIAAPSTRSIEEFCRGMVDAGQWRIDVDSAPTPAPVLEVRA